MSSSVTASVVLLVCTAARLGYAEGDSSQTRWFWENWHVAQVRYQYSFPSDIGDGASVAEHWAQASAFIPIRMKTPLWIGVGLTCEFQRRLSWGVDTSYPAAAVSAPWQRNYHVAQVLPGISFDFSEQSFVYAEADIGMQSDFGDFGRDDVAWTAFGYGGWHITPSFTLRSGLGATGGIGATLVYPVLGCHWRLTRRVAVDALLPSHLMLRGKLLPRLETGLKGEVVSSSFHRWDRNATMAEEVSIFRLTGLFYLEGRVWRDLLVRACGGWHVMRSVTGRGGVPETVVEPASGPVVGCSIRYAYE